MRIKITVCDDDLEALNSLKEQIEVYGLEHNVEIALTTYCYEELLLMDIQDGKICPNILFLDINMPKISGVALAAEIRACGYSGKIIFMTVSDQHYPEAFDVKAYHYLLKKHTSKKRFEEVLSSSIEEVIKEEAEYIVLSRAGEIRKIALDKIRYFEVFKRIITVYYGEAESFEFYSTIGKMENRLLGHGFVRTHRSYLVSIQYIEFLNNKELGLITGEILPVGRAYYTMIRSQMHIFENPTNVKKLKTISGESEDEAEGEEKSG